MVPLLPFRLLTLQVFDESAGRHSCILPAARVTVDSLADDSSSKQSLLLNIVYNRRLIVLSISWGLSPHFFASSENNESWVGFCPLPEMFESFKLWFCVGGRGIQTYNMQTATHSRINRDWHINEITLS
jgi:hypothetical protein